MNKLERKVTLLQDIFIMFCLIMLFIAYIAEIKLAYKSDILPVLGALIIMVPIASYVIGFMVSQWCEGKAQFPRLLAQQYNAEIGSVYLPIGWTLRRWNQVFLAIDSNESVRIVCFPFDGNDAMSFAELQYAGDTYSFPNTILDNSAEEPFGCKIKKGKRKLPGFVKVVHLKDNHCYRVFFLDANKHDLLTISEIFTNLASE